MSTLTQLLGNRELAFEDNLEKGRIWVYSDGNMYSGFCNGFCWKPPGCGIATIEAWGSGGSGAKMCCCGASVSGNPGAYVKKTICVCPTNYVCGYVGRSCNNADSLCFRGCSEASCVCWYGCSQLSLFESGMQPKCQESWKGNNPWGWGNSSGDPIAATAVNSPMQSYIGDTMGNKGSSTQASGAACTDSCFSQCCSSAVCGGSFTNGCLCAQGGKGGLSYCMDDKSAYQCFITGGHCGSRVGPRHNMCDPGHSGCGIICNMCNDGGGIGFIACGYGGDVNCCGSFSCSGFFGCLQTCPCLHVYTHAGPPGQFSTEGGLTSYTPEGDSPQSSWAGSAKMGSMNGMMALSRQPSAVVHNSCWNNNRTCGCYEMEGCYQFVPYGWPGAGAMPCPGVRDQAGRGGMGMVRIKYVPTDGGNTY